MGRRKLDDPKTEDIRIKVSERFLGELEFLKKGTAFEDWTNPEFASYLLSLGKDEHALKERLYWQGKARAYGLPNEALPPVAKEKDIPASPKSEQVRDSSPESIASSVDSIFEEPSNALSSVNRKAN